MPCFKRGSLAGREREIAMLRSAADARGAIVSGAPGMGKTALLREVAHLAADRGMRAVPVRVPPDGHATPGAPADQVAAALGSVADLPALTGVLEGAGPLAVIVDDLQWGSREGIAALWAAVRAAGPAVRLFASVRSDARDAVPAPSADLWLDRITLSPLPVDAMGALATEVLSGPVLPSVGEAVHARSAGVPLFAVETLRAWRDTGALEEVAGYWGLTGDPVPLASMTEAIGARLRALGPGASAVMCALAVLGDDARFSHIASVASLPADDVAVALESLEAAGFVSVPRPGRFEAAHAMYASTSLAEAVATARSRMHGRALSAVRSVAPPGVLARHALNALEPPADLAEILERAARAAEQAASHTEAARWFEHLAEAVDGDDARGSEATLARARATKTFDAALAVDLCTTILGDARAQHLRVAALRERASALRMRGSLDDAMGDLRDALALADEAGRPAIMLEIAVMHVGAARLEEAEAIAQEVAAASPGWYRALGTLAGIAFLRGDLLASRDRWHDAIERCTDETYRGMARHNLGWISVLLGDRETAERSFAAAASSAREAGDAWAEVDLLAAEARMAAWWGEDARAIDRATRAVALAPRLGNVASRIDALDAYGVALLEAGRPREAAEPLGDAVALVKPEMEQRELAFTFAVYAEALLLSGDVAGAVAALAAARERVPLAPMWAIAVDRIDARIAMAAGDAARALRLLEPHLPGDLMAIEHARVEETAAAALARLGRRDEAHVMRDRAVASYAALGMEHRAARLATPTRRSGSGLTAREREVLSLVGDGLTDRQIAARLFLSMGTVRKHIEHVKTKTGTSRRVELIRVADTHSRAAEDTHSYGSAG